MSALSDVQRALNLIRQITREERAVVRMEVLRLMANTIADEVQEIEQDAAQKQTPRHAVRNVPTPKPPNSPKPSQVVPKQPTQPQKQQPNTQPTQPSKPIVP